MGLAAGGEPIGAKALQMFMPIEARGAARLGGWAVPQMRERRLGTPEDGPCGLFVRE